MQDLNNDALARLLDEWLQNKFIGHGDLQEAMFVSKELFKINYEQLFCL